MNLTDDRSNSPASITAYAEIIRFSAATCVNQIVESYSVISDCSKVATNKADSFNNIVLEHR